ncbi:MAG: DNA polymerase [Planctomycetota bacterium]|jgi:hypothetical protein
MKLDDFSSIALVDFEYTAPDGERPDVNCMVVRDFHTGNVWRYWRDELIKMQNPPFSVDAESLVVAYYASAEFSCFRALNWMMPVNVLDLFAEFRNLTNGKQKASNDSLIGALAECGLDPIGALEKSEMRELSMRGGPYTPSEKQDLLDYCQGDVYALDPLLRRTAPLIDLPRALIRGRYMVAAARIETNGVPIDTHRLARVLGCWEDLQLRLIERVDSRYGVFDGKTFRQREWAKWLATNDIPWPALPSGRLALDDDTFRDMARTYPEVSDMRELRQALSQMGSCKLSIGADGRNRCLLSAYRSKTGRNQPSNSQFIFGPATWIRGFIRPEPEFGLAYVDWAQQEFGIAAALSNDSNMLEAYTSGDPYLAFAKQAGAVPCDATKASHATAREQFKQCVLAVQYGMGANSLAMRIRQPVEAARQLLSAHRKTFSRFWEWSEGAVSHAMLLGSLHTVFGWTVHAGHDANPRSLANFPMQANGAEMLRLACIHATEAGIRVCAPVHDALLLEAPLEVLDDAVAQTQQLMQLASEQVLGGFQLRSDAKVTRYPDRYMDPRGQYMWDTVMDLLESQ